MLYPAPDYRYYENNGHKKFTVISLFGSHSTNAKTQWFENA